MKGYLFGFALVAIAASLLWWGYNPHVEETEEHEEKEAVHPISEEAMNEAKIELKKAEPHKLSQTLKKGGWVQINPDKVAHLTAPYESRAIEIYKKAGDQVEKDEVLALLYSPTLSEKKKLLSTTLETQKNAEYELKRQEELFQLGLTTKQEMESKATQYRQALMEAEHAQTIIGNLNSLDNHYQLKAPFSGTIIDRHLVNGEWVDSNETLFVLADLKELKVEFPLFPSESEQVKVNSKIRVYDQEGVVDGILPHLDNDLALKGFAIIRNEENKFHPGSYVNLEIVVNEPYAKVAVEQDAVFDMEDKPHVFVKKEGGFEAREIVKGKQDDQFVEVLSGLDVGEVYSCKNGFRIKADMGKEDVEDDD